MSRPAAAPRSLADRTSRLRRVPARAFAVVLLLLQATTGVLFPLVDAAGPHEATVAAHWDGSPIATARRSTRRATVWS